MSEESPSSPEVTVRRKGALAFLPDTLQYFPYRQDVWENHDSFPSLPPPPRSRRSDRTIEAGLRITETIETDEWIAASTSVALLLVDPQQRSSRHFISLLVRRFVQSSNTAIRGILVIMSSSEESSSSLDERLLDFLEHSGLAWTYLSACSSCLPQVMSWTSCPALSVCTSTTGRKVSVAAEEMALEWHSYKDDADDDPVLSAWNAGTSALSWKQHMAAAFVVPSCIVQ